jgi:peroxiredoxin
MHGQPSTSRRIGVGVLVATALLLVGCASGQNRTGSKGYVAGNGDVVLFHGDKRQQAPVLAGSLIGGGTVDTSSSAGKVIVVNVWASWCAPCRGEAPGLESAWRELRSRGVQFLGLNTRNEASAAQAFQRRYGVTYPSLADPQGQQLLKFSGLVANPQSLPTTIVVDREGKVAAVIAGPISKNTLVDLVESVERS